VPDATVRQPTDAVVQVVRSAIIILMGRHKQRTDLGREFGTTDLIAERGAEGIDRVRELTGGDGTHAVLECVGSKPAPEMALGVVRDGSTPVEGWR
jgi:threonine dehydrogenase-like Zn-dependent dehydrogenase